MDFWSLQIAINWTLCKGALPIPGAKNARQVKESAGALGWRMSADEVRSPRCLVESGSVMLHAATSRLLSMMKEVI